MREPSPATPRDFQHLESGKRYRVVKEFVDFDAQLHRLGEQWTFIRHSFLPYDDGLTLAEVRATNVAERLAEQAARTLRGG